MRDIDNISIVFRLMRRVNSEKQMGAQSYRSSRLVKIPLEILPDSLLIKARFIGLLGNGGCTGDATTIVAQFDEFTTAKAVRAAMEGRHWLYAEVSEVCLPV